MPLSIPNTTLADGYTDPNTFAGNDVFAWGFFTVANNPAFVQLLEGPHGMAVPQPEVYCPPATYPIAGGVRPVSGIRARNAVAGSAAQFFGTLFYPKEPGIQAGTPFNSIISPSGQVGSPAIVPYDLLTTPVDVQSTAAETALWSKTLAALDFANGRSLLWVKASGDALFNRNAADSVTIRARLGPAGATEIWNPGAYTFNAVISANRRGWELDFLLSQANSLVSQRIGGLYVIPSGTGLGTGGSSLQDTSAAGSRQFLGYIYGSPAENWAVDLILQITAQWSVASALNSFRINQLVAQRFSL